MGVDAKWGRFPICPEMSRLVPVCPRLSRFVPVPGPKKDKRGQTRTKRDISGQIGKRPHSASTPILVSWKLKGENAAKKIRQFFAAFSPIPKHLLGLLFAFYLKKNLHGKNNLRNVNVVLV